MVGWLLTTYPGGASNSTFISHSMMETASAGLQHVQLVDLLVVVDGDHVALGQAGKVSAKKY